MSKVIDESKTCFVVWHVCHCFGIDRQTLWFKVTQVPPQVVQVYYKLSRVPGLLHTDY